MSVITKMGDEGMTIGPKNYKITKIDAFADLVGTLDELQSNIGLVFELGIARKASLDFDFIEKLMEGLYDLMGNLYNQSEKSKNYYFLTSRLEILTKDMEKDIPPLKSFILPKGSLLIAQIHVTRAICRRAERKLVSYYLTEEKKEGDVAYRAIPFLNRMSDYFFTLARYRLEITND